VILWGNPCKHATASLLVLNLVERCEGLWFGRTTSAGSGALGHGYKGEGELRGVHAVGFKTRAGRRRGFYVTVCDSTGAELYLLSFDVRTPRGGFRREHSKVVGEARWLLCGNVDR